MNIDIAKNSLLSPYANPDSGKVLYANMSPNEWIEFDPEYCKNRVIEIIGQAVKDSIYYGAVVFQNGTSFTIYTAGGRWFTGTIPNLPHGKLFDFKEGLNNAARGGFIRSALQGWGSIVCDVQDKVDDGG